MGAKRILSLFICVLFFIVAFQGASAKTAYFARTPPYDYGCPVRPEDLLVPCPVQWDPARQGRLDTVTVPFVGVLYGPPFVFPGSVGESSVAGVVFRTRVSRIITAAARVRDADPLPNSPATIGVCFEVIRQTSQAPGTPLAPGPFLGCGLLRQGGSQWVTSMYHDVQLPPGTYRLEVSLTTSDVHNDFTAAGHPVEAFVDSINYALR